MVRSRVIAALLATATVGVAMPATAPAKSKPKRHCVAYKTYKKHGKTYKRCSKYSK